MDRIDQVLTKNNITYWAGGGTLLGAVRHKGLIAWDEDLDLYIFDSDMPNLLAIESDLEAHGLKLHSYFKNTYKIYAQDAQPIPDPNNPGQFLPFGYPAADLFTVALHRRHEKDDVYVLKSRTYYWEWSEDRFTYEQLQNIQRVPFGPLMIPIPSNPELNLNLIFGTSDCPNLWEKYAIEPSWDHRREKVLLGKRGSAFVEIDDFAPAPWQQ
ncbi:MAG: LicD family protein [Verrucomicrobia bacterium]|nr:LicD family protein [Verrucomicrobiota bacterium]MBS0645258.1 LicD family protein [Verrucomicrobiota bacterium]